MNTYAYIIKAKAKATDSKSLFCWFSAKSDSRAEREILNLLEDSGIEVGRGADHQLPIRTNWFVVDDLPEEGTLDDTWCDRYVLGEDGLTWKKIVVAEAPAEPESTVLTAGEQPANDAVPEVNENIQHEQDFTEGEDSHPEYPKLTAVPTMSFRHRVLAQHIGGGEYMYHVDEEQKKEIIALELDQDNSYIQNLLLAAENVEPFKKANEVDIWKAVISVKTVFPVDRKTPELASVIQFLNAWFNTEHIDRGLLTKEWANGNRLSCIQRTSGGANAGGGIKTDRNPDYIHTLETLDYEIAAATLPMDFDIYNIPLSIHRRAKEIITKKESPWKEWSSALRATPGVLDYSRAAIFALIRGAGENVHNFPDSLRRYISANLTESNHEKPTADTLAASRQINSASVTLDAVHDAINGKNETTIPDGVGEEYAFVGNKLGTEARSRAEQPNIENHGNGVFSIDSLVNTPPAQPLSVVDQVRQRSVAEKIKSDKNEEAASDVQMEEVVNDEAQAGTEVSQGETTTMPDESADASGEQTDAVNNESVHQITEQKSDKLYSHLMVDMETMGCGPDAAIVSIGGVFFDPSSGNTGAEFYQVVRLESSMSFGMKPDASTIEWWLKQSPEARSAILVDDAMGLLETLELLADFIAKNAANGSHTVQIWGNGCSFDNVILRRAFALTDTPFPIPYWNDRDVRTMVELGKSVGINPRFDIPFEGDMHNALSDARHQVKYVSTIWQRLTAN